MLIREVTRMCSPWETKKKKFYEKMLIKEIKFDLIQEFTRNKVQVGNA